MAGILYTGATVLFYFEMWDRTVSEEKPAYRPHEAWLLPADISTITLTIRKPGTAADEVKTLSGGGVTYTGRVGRWQAIFDVDGPGAYATIFVGETTDGHTGVEVTQLRARAWPA
jgi:hypothetical protein